MASKPKAKPKAKAKAGAKTQKPIIPSGAWGAKYSEELGNHLCDLLSDGKTLNAICKGDPSLPAPRTIRRWAADPEHPFSPQYTRAREIGYHAMADDYIDIGDTVTEDPGAVAKARLRTESRKWLLSKALPKIYGDRLEHVGKARSRTFIPGKLEDNPFLARTNYAATLAALPEEIRAAYKDGRFDRSVHDNPKQVIKTEWIVEAQKRWRDQPNAPREVPMAVMGLDVAQGGADSTVLAMRYDWWYAPIIARSGSDTPTPSSVAALVVEHRRDSALVVVEHGRRLWGRRP
jgi:hypothetical protein